MLTGLNAKSLAGDSWSQWQLLFFFKMAAVPMSILMLFLIYWLLPNAKVPAKSVIPPAIFVGLALEALKYVNLLMWPVWRAKLRAEYGPFYFSVTIILWSFFNSMIILAGAEWAAQAASDRRNAIATSEP